MTTAAADVTALVAERLAQIEDPLIRTLLEQAIANASAQTPVVPDELQTLRDANRRLHRATRIAAKLVQFIASTFGACPECWGLDAGCPRCRGAGGPGSHDTEPTQLIAWVEPALRRAGYTVVPLDDSIRTGRNDP